MRISAEQWRFEVQPSAGGFICSGFRASGHQVSAEGVPARAVGTAFAAALKLERQLGGAAADLMFAFLKELVSSRADASTEKVPGVYPGWVVKNGTTSVTFDGQNGTLVLRYESSSTSTRLREINDDWMTEVCSRLAGK